MNDPTKRCRALHRLATQIQDSSEALTAALVQDAELTHQSAHATDIPTAIQLLQCFSMDRPFPLDPSIARISRQPLGGIAIDVPLWSPLATIARTVGSAFAAGNRQIIVNLPTC